MAAPGQDRSEWVLGDIIASDPVYLGADDQHYDQLAAGSEGKSSYASYVNYKKTPDPDDLCRRQRRHAACLQGQ